MSIMDMFNFGKSQQQQPAAQAPATPGNIPPNTVTGDPANPTVPNGTVDTSKQNQEPAAPLADFADLWKTDNTQTQPQSGFLGNIDPAKVMDAAKKVDFSKALNQDMVQKISQGGPEAMQAVLQAMNTIAQQTYAQSALASSRMVESALSKAQERFQADLPTAIKRHSVSDNLRNENPIFSNPAVAPIISALEQQLTLKHPNATSQEITKLAQTFVSDFANAAIPKKEEQATAQQVKDSYDWSGFLGG